MTTSEKIFKLLKDKGITRYRLSQDIGVSEGHISDWKSGKSRPTAERLVRLAKYFEVTTDYLLGAGNELSCKIQIEINKLSCDEQQEVLKNLYEQYPKLKE